MAGFQFSPLNTPGDFFGHDGDVYYFGSAHTGGFNATFARFGPHGQLRYRRHHLQCSRNSGR